MTNARSIIFALFILLSCLPLSQNAWSSGEGNFTLASFKETNGKFIEDNVREKVKFYGLSSYYNDVRYYLVEKQSLVRLKDDDQINLENGTWLAAVGRFNVLLVKNVHTNGVAASGGELNEIEIVKLDQNKVFQLVTKPELHGIAPELDQIRYAHLWMPFAWLSKAVEGSLEFIYRNIVSNWAAAIVVFAILLKLVLIPLGILQTRSQRKVSVIQAKLEPVLADIKSKYDGEEAHDLFMAAHKKLNVSPFYSIKPILASLIQIPILIAVFNAIGEMPQFAGQHFLWISDLAYTDSLFDLGVSVPMLGNTFNFLPFVMTGITIFSTSLFQNKIVQASELKRQKRNLHFMAAAFLILFYPFPAVMVLYWTLTNILQTIQQQLVKI